MNSAAPDLPPYTVKTWPIGKPKPYEKNIAFAISTLQKIRAGGSAHHAHSHYEAPERINDYTANYHHGEDASGAAEPVLDPTELMGYISTTLKTVNPLPT
jgi:hypothetical protein